MGLADFFRGRNNTSLAASTLQLGAGARYSATGWTFQRVSTSVLSNPTGQRCIGLWGSNISRPEWIVYQRGTKEPAEGPQAQALLDLLNGPNEKTSGTMFRRSGGRDIATHGKSFWIKERGRDGFGDKGPTTKLRRLAPQRCTVLGNEDDDLLGFIYQDRNGLRLPVLPDDMLYWHFPHPERDFDGLAPALVAGLPSETDNAAATFNYNLLSNDGAIPGVMVIKDLTPDQFKGWVAAWQSGETPGKQRFMGGEATYQKIGSTNQELAYDKLRADSQEDICRAFGIPFVLINPTDATYANMAEARALAMQSTFVPAMDLLGDETTIQLGDEFGGVDVAFHYGELEELNEAANSVVDRGVKLLDRQVITINEFREKDLGLDPVEWGDMPMAPLLPMKPVNQAPAGGPAEQTGAEPAVAPPEPPKPPRKSVQPATTKAVNPSPADFERRVQLYEARMARQMRSFFQRQGRVISARVRSQAGKSYSKALADDQWSDPMRWSTELAADLDGIYTDTVDAFATDIMARLGKGAFDANSARIRSYIERRVQQDSVYINSTTTDDVRSLIADGMTKGESIATIADSIAGYFSGDDATAAMRAERCARSEVIGAANYGVIEGARQSGVATGKTWAVAGGGECETCAELDGETVGMDENFSDGEDQPPAHPNAVLEGSTFVPYGELSEMVAASYEGPAIVVRAGSKSVTIGPNHPMLTARGLVPAKLLREGDQLLYDRRHDDPILHGNEAHFEQVPLVEDAFKAFRTVAGGSRTSPTSHDLHGDRVFCQGEVEVVRPARRLLLVPDLIGLQELREGQFVVADAKLQLEAASGSEKTNGKAVLLASPDFVSASCSRHRIDPVVAADTPRGAVVANPTAVSALTLRYHPHIVALTVDVIKRIWFSGKAFDASTAGLYASNGFLVTNCRCCVLIETDTGATDGSSDITEE